MNPIDRSLHRLLKAAGRSPDSVPESPPSALEQRVLAQWRSTPAEDEFASLAGLYRPAAICAGLIMILSAGLTWFQNRSEATGAVALANYALTIQEPP
jgi:hypothetical protein